MDEYVKDQQSSQGEVTSDGKINVNLIKFDHVLADFEIKLKSTRTINAL